jgi:hypothetical protein
MAMNSRIHFVTQRNDYRTGILRWQEKVFPLIPAGHKLTPAPKNWDMVARTLQVCGLAGRSCPVVPAPAGKLLGKRAHAAKMPALPADFADLAELIVFCRHLAHPSVMTARIPASRTSAAVCGLLLLFCSCATAAPDQPALPAEVPINHAAGRGGLLFIPVRLESGDEVRMIVDTGAPITLLDKSLVPRLGKQLQPVTIQTFRGRRRGGIYPAPKFHLGNFPLLTWTNVVTCDLKKLLPLSDHPVLGVLGMDCLHHYCVQLDFEAERLRFLDSNHLAPAGLGKAFPLEFVADPAHYGIPIIQHAGLLGGPVTNIVIDTGNNDDGMVESSAIRRHAPNSYSGGPVKRVKHYLAVEGIVKHDVGLPGCIWAGNTYTNIGVGRGSAEAPNWIGLRFLARHLVTLDFPNQTLYLKQTRSGPLPVED